MPIISLYILREWVKGFLLAILVTLGILLLNNIYGELPDFLEASISLSQIIHYYIILIPGFTPLILPLSVLLSTLLVLGNLHKNNELTAMQSSGLSIFQITKPIWIFVSTLTAINLYLNTTLIPWSISESKQFKNDTIYSSVSQSNSPNDIGFISPLTYMNLKENRLWFLTSFNLYTLKGSGLYLCELDSKNREIKRIQANLVSFDKSNHTWTFLNGREILMDPLNGEPLQANPFDQLLINHWPETPQLMYLFHQEPKDLSFFELKTILNQLPSIKTKEALAYSIRYHRMISSSFMPLIVLALAIPFVTRGVRRNPMVNISKCIGLFLAFYFIDSITSFIAEAAIIPVLVAAWFPNLLVLSSAFYWYKKKI